MQRERGGRRDIFDEMNAFRGFGNFGGGFGSHRSRIPGFHHGKDPFDDPFFTQPFESIFVQKPATHEMQKTNGAKGIMIEVISSDNEGENDGEETVNEGETRKGISESSEEPYVQHPDDDVVIERKSQNYASGNESKRPQSMTHNFSYQTCKVTCGGVDGAYYTSVKNRKMGTDGVVLEESKEADKTTGQATYKISRGIRNKGHSITRKLNSDGKVDTMQTLHNLDEDQVSGFQKAWEVNNAGKLPFWKDPYGADVSTGSSSDTQTGENMGGCLLPSLQGRIARDSRVDNETGRASGGKPKKIVRINIE